MTVQPTCEEYNCNPFCSEYLFYRNSSPWPLFEKEIYKGLDKAETNEALAFAFNNFSNSKLKLDLETVHNAYEAYRISQNDLEKIKNGGNEKYLNNFLNSSQNPEKIWKNAIGIERHRLEKEITNWKTKNLPRLLIKWSQYDTRDLAANIVSLGRKAVYDDYKKTCNEVRQRREIIDSLSCIVDKLKEDENWNIPDDFHPWLLTKVSKHIFHDIPCPKGIQDCLKIVKKWKIEFEKSYRANSILNEIYFNNASQVTQKLLKKNYSKKYIEKLNDTRKKSEKRQQELEVKLKEKINYIDWKSFTSAEDYPYIPTSEFHLL